MCGRATYKLTWEEIVALYQSFAGDTKKAKEITEQEILASKEIFVIYGRSESGKTTLALHLCTLAIAAEQKRIPIYLDLSQIKAGTEYLNRAIKRFVGASSIDIDKHLDQGDFLIAIDTFSNRQRDSRAFKRKVDMVKKFIAEFGENKFVLFSDESAPISARVEKSEKPEFDHKTVFIHPMRRSGIRELSKRWLEPSGLHTPTNVKAVLDKLAAFNLPRTAHVVSMVLWTLEKKKSTGPVNEASLLQRFVEANLNKSDPANIERGTLDFVIKEAFLSHLAHRFKNDDLAQLDKNELIVFVVNFFKSRSWHYDAAEFVDDLLIGGILQQYTDDDGTYVQFRFRCLQEYFEARYLQENPKALDALFSEQKFYGWVREIDILTGLTRNNPDLIHKLMESLKAIESAQAFKVADRIAEFNTFKLQLMPADAASLALVQEVQDAGATDEEINALMDMQDEAPREQRKGDDGGDGLR